MPAWVMDWSEITPQIVLGNGPVTADDIERIRDEAKVSALFSLQADECLTRLSINYEAHQRLGQRLGLVLERCPIRDFDTLDMRRRLPQAVQSLTRLLRRGHRVYTHCSAGIGRSPLTVLGYLAFVEGYTPDEALAWLRSRRPAINPNLQAFYGCRQDLTRCYQARIAERARQSVKPGAPKRADWYRAEKEVIRAVLGGGLSTIGHEG